LKKPGTDPKPNKSEDRGLSPGNRGADPLSLGWMGIIAALRHPSGDGPAQTGKPEDEQG